MFSLAYFRSAKFVREAFSPSIQKRETLRAVAFTFALSVAFATQLNAQGNADVGVNGIAGRGDTRTTQKARTVSPDVSKMIAEGSLPPSRALDFANVENANSYHLGELPASVLRQGDADDTGKRGGSKRLRIGVARDLSFKLDALKNASVFSVPGGEARIFTVISDKAKQVRLFLSEVDIPAGGRLYIYSRENPEQVFGPYTKRGADATGEFWTPPVPGESATVELFLPEGVSFEKPAFSVTKVNHIFRDPQTTGADAGLKSDADTIEAFAAGSCNLNVTSAWAQVAKSVGLMQFSSGGGEYVCTGTLLNSVNGDMTPYFLTANHCISTASEAQSLRVTWFYDSASASTRQSSGANLLTTSYTSDATLLMINGALPAGLFWSGWSPSVINTNTSFTALHHPQGDYKRITFGRKTGNYDGPDDEGNRSLHEVRWNTNGGTTEGGSSGSGLWVGTPDDARLAGNLLGGAASCGNLTGADYYGRFDVSYPLIADLLAGGSDDAFEDNDTRETASEISPGSLSNLIVKATDEDWFRITVPAGSRLNFRADLNNNNGDIDTSVFRAGEIAADATSSGANNSQIIDLTNFSDSALVYTIRIFLAGDTRNEYALNTTLTSGNPCNFTATSSLANAAASSVAGNVAVNTSLGQCRWSARSNNDWITLTSATSGSGNGNVAYQLAANTSTSARTGTLIVAGQTVTVTQGGKPKRRLFGSRVRGALR